MKFKDCVVCIICRGRAPQGARGLKCVIKAILAVTGLSRAPQGARGLKFA